MRTLQPDHIEAPSQGAPGRALHVFQMLCVVEHGCHGEAGCGAGPEQAQCIIRNGREMGPMLASWHGLALLYHRATAADP